MIFDWGGSTAHAQLPGYVPGGGVLFVWGTGFTVTPGIIRITDESLRTFSLSNESLKGSF